MKKAFWILVVIQLCTYAKAIALLWELQIQARLTKALSPRLGDPFTKFSSALIRYCIDKDAQQLWFRH